MRRRGAERLSVGCDILEGDQVNRCHMKKPTQQQRIIGILEEHGSIDSFYAIETKLTCRLGARVHDLRNLGWEIETKELPNKDTVYQLVARPKAEQTPLPV